MESEKDKFVDKLVAYSLIPVFTNYSIIRKNRCMMKIRRCHSTWRKQEMFCLFFMINKVKFIKSNFYDDFLQ